MSQAAEISKFHYDSSHQDITQVSKGAWKPAKNNNVTSDTVNTINADEIEED